MRPPLGIELTEDVIEEEQWRPPVELGQEVELGQLERQDRRALLSARGEPGQVATGEIEREVVSMRPDHGRPVPDLLLGGVDEPASEGVTRALTGLGRGVRDVAKGQPAGRRLFGGDLAMGGRERRSQRLEQAQTGRHDPSTGLEEALVPEPQLVARRLLLADRPQEAVALLERSPVRPEVVGVGGETSRGERVQCRSPERWRADHQQHLLGREQHDPQVPAEPARAPADAVDADPFATARAVGAGPLDGDLEDIAADAALDPGEVLAPADQLAVGARSMRPAPPEQGDGLEQAGLAGGVRAPDQVRAGRERDLEPGVSAQVEGRERIERGDARTSSGRASRHGRSGRRRPA